MIFRIMRFFSFQKFESLTAQELKNKTPPHRSRMYIRLPYFDKKEFKIKADFEKLQICIYGLFLQRLCLKTRARSYLKLAGS